MTWGHGGYGGYSGDVAEQLSAGVQFVVGNAGAFAALNAARGAFYVYLATHAHIDNDDCPVAAPTQDETSSCSDDAESGEDEVTWWPADQVMHDEANDDAAAAAEDEASGSDDENDASVAESAGDGENDAAAAEWPDLDAGLDLEFWAFAYEDAAGR